MKNIESKFSVKDFGKIKKSLKKNRARFVEKLNQLDTYYCCRKGRLKIREINKKSFELIYYQRPNQLTPKRSDFEVIKLNKSQCNELKDVFPKIFGIKNIIKKTRYLWMYENTRIHLDMVLGLGKFIELETAANNISLKEARKEHFEIINILALSGLKKLSQSYCEIKRNNKKVKSSK